jgi:hypothetical protein
MNLPQTSEKTQVDRGKVVETSTAWRRNNLGWLISCCCCRGWRNIVCHFPPLCSCTCGRSTWQGHVNTIRALTGNCARYLSDKTINAHVSCVSHQVHKCERFIRQQPLLSLAKYHTRVVSRCVTGVCPPQANRSLHQEIHCWWNMRLMPPVVICLS